MRAGIGAATVWVVGGMTLAAASLPDRQTTLLDAVFACRSIAGTAERLACFDRTTTALGNAAERKDVLVVDRAQVQQARRSLFGFTMPKLPMLGFGSKDDPGPSEITASIRSVRQDRDGTWLLTLEDGAVWHQTDQTMLRHDPHPGSSAVIRHGTLGTFFLRVDGQIGFRAKRES